MADYNTGLRKKRRLDAKCKKYKHGSFNKSFIQFSEPQFFVAHFK